MTRFLASVCLAFLLPVGAFAQGAVCGDRAAIIEKLSKKYGEHRVGLGLSRENGVVEIYTSEATGSWTILMSLPNGVTCLMAAGAAWEAEDPPTPGDPA